MLSEGRQDLDFTVRQPFRVEIRQRLQIQCLVYYTFVHGSWIVSLLALAILLTLAQAPNAQTGSVEGIVVRAGTNEPIEGAQLRMSAVTAQPGSDSPLPTTGRDGKFTAAGLAPGRYLMVAVKSGYAAQVYGARQTGITGLAGIGTREEDLAAVGALIDVVAGQVARNVVIRMTPAATVSGRVLGANGEALVAMQVELLPVAFDASGHRYLLPLAQVDTDDRGEYRLFSVEPGRYYITARWSSISVARQEVNSELRAVDAANSNGRSYSPAYYPSSPDVAHASFVEVRAGENLSNLDVVMRPPSPQPLRQIRGRVIDSTTGQAPPPNAGSSFALISRDAEYLSSMPAFDPHLMEDGTFELRDVAEGAYWLVVRVSSARANTTGTGRTAIMPLDVGGGDVDGVTISLRPIVVVSGRVTVDGGPWNSAEFEKLQVRLNANRIGPFTMNMSPNPSSAFFEIDGTFAMANVYSGDYELVFNGLPPDAYVKEARYGGADALMQKISIGGESSSVLEISVSTKSGQLTGGVADRDRRPVSDVEAVLIPEGDFRRSDRYKTARTDANGRFLIRGIAPGNYRVYAWESIDRFRYFDREFVRQFEGSGKIVRIEEGARGTIDLDLIPSAK